MPQNLETTQRLPRAGLHAPHDELGLNLPTIWEDYCAAAMNSWDTHPQRPRSPRDHSTRLPNPGHHQIKKLATRNCITRSQGRHTTLPLYHRPQHRRTISGRFTSPRGPGNLVTKPYFNSTHKHHTYHNRRRRLPNYQPTLNTNR
jgi:hypothetical protein